MTSNRIALVTGAVKGIGKAILERLVEEGFFVIAIDVDEDGGKILVNEFQQKNVRFIKVDIANSKEVETLFEIIKKDYHHLDVLVNNAGIIRDNMIWNMPEDDFDLVVNIDLKGPWLLCKEAAKLMKMQNYGKIVNIASRAWLGNRGQSNYSAAKAGVVALTRVLALELGKYNVLVNAVAPGLIDTPLTQKLTSDVLERLIQAQPTKSMGKPQDVANVVAFLVSDKMNFITGQTIYVDGGKSIGANF